MASIVKRSRDDPILWSPAAIVRMPLQSIVDAHSLVSPWINRPLEGGWLREVDLSLDSGRLAYLGERRRYPGEFTVYLVLHHKLFFFKADYDEVIRFIAPLEGSVVLLSGQVRWWRKG